MHKGAILHMSRTISLLFLGLQAIAFSALAVTARGRAGKTGLWISWAAASLTFGYLGYVDWHRTPNPEAPLACSLMVASLPPFFAALVVESAAAKHESTSSQWLSRAATCFLTTFPVAMLGLLFGP